MKIEWKDYVARYVNCEIPMRDGTITRADIYMPAGEGPFSAVVMRSPYLKSMAITPHYAQWGKYYANHGLAFVMCDVRGRGDSDGTFHPFFNEMNDGHDTLEWVAKLPWSTGKIGMDGNSYNAHTAWMTAKSKSPYLKAMTVSGVPGDMYQHGTQYMNGMKTLYLALWMMMTDGRTNQIPGDVYGMARPYEFLPDLLKQCLSVSPEKIPEVLGFSGKHWIESLNRTAGDGFWEEAKVRGYMENSSVATMHVTGWFDSYLPGTIDGFRVLCEEGSSLNDQYLMIGPWTHNACVAPVRKLNDLDFGEEAEFELLAQKVKFFHHYLNGKGAISYPKIRVFDMGIKEWYTGEDFPESVQQEYFMTQSELKDVPEGSTSFSYSPLNPTTDLMYVEPSNIASDLKRDDIAVFRMDVRNCLLRISGEINFDMSLKIKGKDADLVTTVADKYPDGRVLPLVMNGMKLEFQQDEAFLVKLTMPYLLHTFEPGHQLMVIVRGSSVPVYVPAPYEAEITILGNSRCGIPVFR
jgi:putative CocE/NonD family hydrolase